MVGVGEELQKKIDRQARILVQTLVNLLGFDGKLAEYTFLAFCRRYATKEEDSWHQLHQYFQDKKIGNSFTTTPYISRTITSSSFHLRPIDYISQYLFDREGFSPPSLLHNTPPHLILSGQEISTASPSSIHSTRRSSPGPGQESRPKCSMHST